MILAHAPSATCCLAFHLCKSNMRCLSMMPQAPVLRVTPVIQVRKWRCTCPPARPACALPADGDPLWSTIPLAALLALAATPDDMLYIHPLRAATSRATPCWTASCTPCQCPANLGPKWHVQHAAMRDCVCVGVSWCVGRGKFSPKIPPGSNACTPSHDLLRYNDGIISKRRSAAFLPQQVTMAEVQGAWHHIAGLR